MSNATSFPKGNVPWNVGRRGLRRSLADRFWPKVTRSSDETSCWPWQGARDRKGYGKVNLGRQAYGKTGGAVGFAHRVSWELHYGPIPSGLAVLHRCDNPPCCRPSHLFLGTLAENNADMVAKGRHWSQRRGERSHAD